MEIQILGNLNFFNMAVQLYTLLFHLPKFMPNLLLHGHGFIGCKSLKLLEIFELKIFRRHEKDHFMYEEMARQKSNPPKQNTKKKKTNKVASVKFDPTVKNGKE